MGTVKTITVAPDLSKVLVTVETVARGRGPADRQDDLLGGQAAALRRQRHRPRYAAVRLLHRHAADDREGQAATHLRRPARSAGPPGRRPRAPPSSWRASGWARSAWARRSSSATSRSAPCSAGTSATSPAASPSMPSCATPFDKYVHEDSSFWNASGLSVKLDANGIDVQFESLRALLLGGIAFDTAADPKSPVAAQHSPLPALRQPGSREVGGLRPPAAAACRTSPGSVAGLPVGADVTLHGLKIGEVTDVEPGLRPEERPHRGAGALPDRGRPHHRHRRRPGASPRHARRRDGQARACAPPCRRRA